MLPRLSVSLVYGTRYFGRVLEGTQLYEKSELGSVFLNTLSLQAAIELKTRTLLGVGVPVGIVAVYAAGGGKHVTGGLGDIEIHLSQELVSLFIEDPERFSIMLRGGLVTPSGRYEPEARLSVTDLSGAPDGSLGVVTYNAQASLGADSWSPFAGLGVRWQAAKRVGLFVDGTVLIPASRTRDNLQWGIDASTRAGVSVEILAERVSLIANADYRHHFEDEVPVVDEASGVTMSERVGGRDEVAVSLGVGVAISKILSCSLDVRVPVWQRVGGVQLVETISGTAACAIVWGL